MTSSAAAATAAAAAIPPASSAVSSALSAVLLAPSSRSRHSLYGSEDRIILDLGSRVWKVGYSGEAAPRAVFDVAGASGERSEDGTGISASAALWHAGCAMNATDLSRIERKLKRWLRRSFYKYANILHLSCLAHKRAAGN